MTKDRRGKKGKTAHRGERKGNSKKFLLAIEAIVLFSLLLVVGVVIGKEKSPTSPLLSKLFQNQEDVISKQVAQVENQSFSAEELIHFDEEGKAFLEGVEAPVSGPELTDQDQLLIERLPENARYYKKDTNRPDQVTLTFGGDICFDDTYTNMGFYRDRANGIFDCIDEGLLNIMQSADVLMMNNEFTYTNRGTPTPGKTFTFRSKPENAFILFDLGVDIVSLANNHAYDYGEISLLDTLEVLDLLQMPYVGAGRNLSEAEDAVYFLANDMIIGYLSATQIERNEPPDTKAATETSAGVFRALNPKRLEERIAEAKQHCDYLVVYIHWGTESVNQPDWLQMETAPKLAAAGADLVIGDHPHVLQGITYSGTTPIFYSMGNYWFNSKTVYTGLTQVVLTKDSVESVQFIPALQSGSTTRLLDGREKAEVLQMMRSLSPKVQIDENGFISQ